MKGKWSAVCLLVVGLCHAMVSCAEEAGAAAQVSAAVSGADADGDGKLSFEEFKSARLKLIAEQFNRMDTNKDGYLDGDERLRAVTELKLQLQHALAPPAANMPESVNP